MRTTEIPEEGAGRGWQRNSGQVQTNQRHRSPHLPPAFPLVWPRNDQQDGAEGRGGRRGGRGPASSRDSAGPSCPGVLDPTPGSSWHPGTRFSCFSDGGPSRQGDRRARWLCPQRWRPGKAGPGLAGAPPRPGLGHPPEQQRPPAERPQPADPGMPGPGTGRRPAAHPCLRVETSFLKSEDRLLARFCHPPGLLLCFTLFPLRPACHTCACL